MYKGNRLLTLATCFSMPQFLLYHYTTFKVQICAGLSVSKHFLQFIYSAMR